MSKRTEVLKVNDKHDFVYQVELEHYPHHGFSCALYNGRIIGQVELGKIQQPYSDDDRAWKKYLKDSYP